MGQNWSIRRGISMAETVVATLLVGMVMVTTLQIVAPIVRSGTVMGDKMIATNLANEMIEEITTKLFTDPNVVDPDAIGINSGESASSRPDFDDIDDYDGWSSIPPAVSDMTPMANMGEWNRAVSVDHVLVDDPSTTSLTNTGLKRIVVRVKRNGVLIYKAKSLQSSRADLDNIFIKGN